MNKDLLLESPKSLEILGETLFIKVPLYKAKTNYLPIYINQALFCEYIAKSSNFNWDHAALTLSNLFSNTLSQENSTGERVGWAYCDKQADPLDLSLAGNLGSGRSYYFGKHFNIKGEQTPLAVSDREEYSNGILNMEDGLWETLVANSLQMGFKPGVFSVLAVLKLNEVCIGKYKGEKVELPRVQIIRVLRDSELERISHLFYQKKPLSKQQLRDIAQGFGIQEASKFIERIEHGMWSASNISTRGHLIDLQTVCAVKGRFPQCSATVWHPENYFGFEYEGQLKILQSLVSCSEINVENVDYDFLNSEMQAVMKENMLQGFLKLMGFPYPEKILWQFYVEVSDLFSIFNYLSRKCYFRRHDFSTNRPLSLLLHLYDFSLFFRFFPILKEEKTLQFCDYLDSLKGQNLFNEEDFSFLARKDLTEQDQYLTETVLVKFKACFFSKEESNLLNESMLIFIKKYALLFDKIIAFFQFSLEEVATRAYVINEDRYYMLPVCTLSYYLCFNHDKQSNEHTSKLIALCIKACQRNPNKSQAYITDLRIYKEGYSYFSLDGVGYYQIVIVIFDKTVASQWTDKIELIFDETSYQVSLETTFNQELKFKTNKIELNKLLKGFSRTYSLNQRQIKITDGKKEVLFTPLVQTNF